MTDKLLIEAREVADWLEREAHACEHSAKETAMDHPQAMQSLLGARAAMLRRFAASVRGLAHRSQQEAAQEPTGWQVWWGLGTMRPHWPPFKTRSDAETHASMIRSNTEVRPLYCASHAPSEIEARKPLTVQQMNVIYRSAFGLIDSRLVGQQIDFVRAIEAAHGITDAALSASGQKGEPT